MSQENVTLGELKRMLEFQNMTLSEIKATVREQNGRVRKLEEDAIRIKSFWAAGTFAVVVAGDWLKHKLGF